MDKTETVETLHRIAARMRSEAEDTLLPQYRSLMLRTAVSLEAEADHLMEPSERVFAVH